MTYVDLGQETSFNSLLAYGNNPFIQASLDRVQPKSVLDIGTYSGEALYLLYHSCDSTQHLEGLERDDESTVLASLKSNDIDHNPDLRYGSLFERYLCATKSMVSDRSQIVDPNVFANTIKTRYETDILSSNSLLLNYDLIILSNIIHYMTPEEAKIVFEKVNRLRHDETLIYIHIRALPNFDFGQADCFKDLLALCDAAASEWRLDRFESRHSNDNRHFTFTNLSNNGAS